MPHHVQTFSVGSAGPTDGILVADDDDTVHTSLIRVKRAADTTYDLVTSGWMNDSFGSFTNTIYGPYTVSLLSDVDPVEPMYDLIADVEALVDAEVLTSGQANGLVNPLKHALRSLEKESTPDTCNQLGDFMREVEAKVPPLTEAQADDLTGGAEAIRAMLGCP